MKRVVSLDMARGIAILVVILVHRLHYSWSAFASGETLRAHFHGIEAVFIVIAFPVMTMAGMFYVITGGVTGLMFQDRVRRSKGRGVGKLVLAAAVAGGWLLALHLIQRVFLMNGFASPDGLAPPRYALGQLTGLIQTGHRVPFYWNQLTESGTLSLIGSIVIVVSLLLGTLVRNNGYRRVRRNVQALVLAGSVVLALSPVLKFLLYPVYDGFMESGQYLKAALVGYTAHRFGLFPQLGFGFFGAAAGLLLSRRGNPAVLRFLGRSSLAWVGIGLLGLLVTVFLDSGVYPLVRRVQGACVVCMQLALFLFLLRFGLKKWDFVVPAGETRSVERETQGWVSPVLQAEQDREAQQARRATGWARKRS